MKYIAVLVCALFLICSVQAQCPSICPAVYQPVCGFNGRCYKQFSNSCQMGVENCNKKQNFRQVSLGNCNGSKRC
ncbi:enhancer of split M1 protein-like [Lucilia sericata]|uniref:enhancer of split M1 protein-like n=1 Tax=Lucilia sericata TaxID=13632 RepID=UPI0018A7F341|nr:enhancer of split M1 protein-like [Lucilia sericata]